MRISDWSSDVCSSDLAQHTPMPTLHLLQLFARAAVRSRYDEDDGILWSFLTPEDFAKTNRTSADVASVLAHIRETLPKSPVTALLWQDNLAPTSIQILLSGDEHIIGMIASKEGTERLADATAIRLNGAFPSFRDAEAHVRSLIREAL